MMEDGKVTSTLEEDPVQVEWTWDPLEGSSESPCQFLEGHLAVFATDYLFV